MVNIIIEMLIDLVILIFDGVFIAICASNGWWWGMATVILFVPHNANNLMCSYTSFLEALLNYLRHSNNDDNNK